MAKTLKTLLLLTTLSLTGLSARAESVGTKAQLDGLEAALGEAYGYLKNGLSVLNEGLDVMKTAPATEIRQTYGNKQNAGFYVLYSLNNTQTTKFDLAGSTSLAVRNPNAVIVQFEGTNDNEQARGLKLALVLENSFAKGDYANFQESNFKCVIESTPETMGLLKDLAQYQGLSANAAVLDKNGYEIYDMRPLLEGEKTPEIFSKCYAGKFRRGAGADGAFDLDLGDSTLTFSKFSSSINWDKATRIYGAADTDGILIKINAKP